MGGTIRLAGDGLTVKEIDQVFREASISPLAFVVGRVIMG